MVETTIVNLEHKKMRTYPNLPDPQWIKKQICYLGGNVFIVGLTQAQADEIVRFARENCDLSPFHGTRIETENPLSERVRRTLAQNGRDVPEGSVEINLGHTVGCHLSLCRALRITLDPVST